MFFRKCVVLSNSDVSFRKKQLARLYTRTIPPHEVSTTDKVFKSDKIYTGDPAESFPVLHYLKRENRIKEGVKLFTHIHNTNTQNYTCTFIIIELIKQGLIDDAFFIYKKMLNVKLKPETRTESTLIMALIDFCKFDMHLFKKKLHQLKHLPKTFEFERMIRTLVNTIEGEPYAWFLFSYIKYLGFRPESGAYERILSMKMRNKEDDIVLELIYDMHKYSILTNGLFLSLLQRLCQYRMMDSARKLIEDINNLGFKLDSKTLTVSVNSFLKSKNVAVAFELYNMAQKDHVVLDEIFYGVFIDGLIRCNRLTVAKKIFKRAQQRKKLNVATYGSLIRGITKEDLNEAMLVFSEMKKNGFAPNERIYTLLLNSAIAHDDKNISIRLFSEMNKLGMNRVNR